MANILDKIIEDKNSLEKVIKKVNFRIFREYNNL